MNQKSFETLYERWAEAMYRFALGLAGHEDIAKDIVQETFDQGRQRQRLSPKRLRMSGPTSSR